MTLSLIFLGANIFFVLAEFSIVKAQAAKLEVLHNRGKTRAGLVLLMMKRMDHYFSAIQIGVTMSTLGLGWAGEPAVARLFDQNMAWPHWLSSGAAFCLIIYLQIVFAELVPRYIAVRHAETLALWVAFPLEIYYRIVRLPVWILSKSSVAIAKLLGSSPIGEHETAFSQEEMRVLMGTAQEKGLLPLDRLLLIENLFDFSSLKVRDAMVPKDRLTYLSATKSWDDNLQTIKTNHFSRYPVTPSDPDHIDGFIHVKDLVGTSNNVDLNKLKRPIQKIQDTEPLSPLLNTMTAQGKHLVLCMKGDKVSGLITLEDVLEEIVGEIHDEFDAPRAWSLHQYLLADLVDIEMQPSTPQQVIHDLTHRLIRVEPALNLNFVERSVQEREQQLPTAIGKGVAVPHTRLASLTQPRLAIGRTSKSFGFTPPDKEPVALVFLILTPTSAPLEQLRILSRVAMLINNETVRKQIFKAKSATELVDVIRTSEALIAG